jgi:hypothetical protein
VDVGVEYVLTPFMPSDSQDGVFITRDVSTLPQSPQLPALDLQHVEVPDFMWAVLARGTGVREKPRRRGRKSSAQ